MEYGFKSPTNKVIAYAPNTVFMQELKAAVATLKPGLLAARGDSDIDGVLASIGSKVPIGVVGYEQSFLGSYSYISQRPETLLSAYNIGAKVPMLAGTNFACNLKLAPGFAVTKGDRLSAFVDGTVVPFTPDGDGIAIKIPFEKSTTEVDTGIELPANVIVTNAYVEVDTAVAASTIDVGLLSTEANGDADGFIDGASCATTGIIAPVTHAITASAGKITPGAFIADKVAAVGTPAETITIMKPYVTDGVTKTISYTTTDSAIAGNIVLVIKAVGAGDIGNAERTLAASTEIQDVMAKVNI